MQHSHRTSEFSWDPALPCECSLGLDVALRRPRVPCKNENSSCRRVGIARFCERVGGVSMLPRPPASWACKKNIDGQRPSTLLQTEGLIRDCSTVVSTQVMYVGTSAQLHVSSACIQYVFSSTSAHDEGERAARTCIPTPVVLSATEI